MYLFLGNNERTLTAFSLQGKFLRGITGFPGEKAINPSLSSGECGVKLRVIVTPDVGFSYPHSFPAPTWRKNSKLGYGVMDTKSSRQRAGEGGIH